jgi:hypothetical protein
MHAKERYAGRRGGRVDGYLALDEQDGNCRQ